MALAWETHRERSVSDGGPQRPEKQAGVQLLDPNDPARLRAELEACNGYLRDTLELLAGKAGVSLLNEDGTPLRNFQIVERIAEKIEGAAT